MELNLMRPLDVELVDRDPYLLMYDREGDLRWETGFWSDEYDGFVVAHSAESGEVDKLSMIKAIAHLPTRGNIDIL